jgi:hypothetical protein
MRNLFQFSAKIWRALDTKKLINYTKIKMVNKTSSKTLNRISTIAEKLNISVEKIRKESLKDFLERELLESKAELFSLANKYGVKSIKEFDRLIRRGKIHETSESRDDFFKIDSLEAKCEILKKLLKSIR